MAVTLHSLSFDFLEATRRLPGVTPETELTPRKDYQSLAALPRPQAPLSPKGGKSDYRLPEVKKVGYLHNLWKYERVFTVLSALGAVLILAGVAVAIFAPYAPVGILLALLLSGLTLTAVGVARANPYHFTPYDLSDYTHERQKKGLLHFFSDKCSCVPQQLADRRPRVIQVTFEEQ